MLTKKLRGILEEKADVSGCGNVTSILIDPKLGEVDDTRPSGLYHDFDPDFKKAHEKGVKVFEYLSKRYGSSARRERRERGIFEKAYILARYYITSLTRLTFK